MPSKKLLMIAYFYPPFAEVGVVRVAKFVKYLKKKGKDITVLTVKEKYYQTSNDSYVQDVNGVKKIRTPRIPSIISGINEEGFYWTPVLFFYLLYQMIFNRPQMVYLTGGPFYHWILAPLIKLFGVEYILDFRDPWKLSPYAVRKNGFLGRLTFKLSTYIERFAIKHAKIVINVTNQATKMYKDEYPEFLEKFVTITNGFDSDDFIEIEPLSISKFDIVYSGKFGTFRDVRPFFEAFSMMIKEHNFTPEDIRFVWIGKVEEHIINMMKEMKLENYVEMLGFLPYRKNLQYIKGSQIALLIAGKHPYEPTTKIFDYMALQKYILGITDAEGFVVETLGMYPLGGISKNNVNAVLEKLEEGLNNFTEKNETDKNALIRFERNELTEKLDKFFDKRAIC
ncbi:MAG: hypothetical protein ACWGHH_03910 [Sulfurovaceae bacterium]